MNEDRLITPFQAMYIRTWNTLGDLPTEPLRHEKVWNEFIDSLKPLRDLFQHIGEHDIDEKQEERLKETTFKNFDKHTRYALLNTLSGKFVSRIEKKPTEKPWQMQFAIALMIGMRSSSSHIADSREYDTWYEKWFRKKTMNKEVHYVCRDGANYVACVLDSLGMWNADWQVCNQSSHRVLLFKKKFVLATASTRENTHEIEKLKRNDESWPQKFNKSGTIFFTSVIKGMKPENIETVRWIYSNKNLPIDKGYESVVALRLFYFGVFKWNSVRYTLLPILDKEPLTKEHFLRLDSWKGYFIDAVLDLADTPKLGIREETENKKALCHVIAHVVKLCLDVDPLNIREPTVLMSLIPFLQYLRDDLNELLIYCMIAFGQLPSRVWYIDGDVLNDETFGFYEHKAYKMGSQYASIHKILNNAIAFEYRKDVYNNNIMDFGNASPLFEKGCEVYIDQNLKGKVYRSTVPFDTWVRQYSPLITRTPPTSGKNKRRERVVSMDQTKKNRVDQVEEKFDAMEISSSTKAQPQNKDWDSGYIDEKLELELDKEARDESGLTFEDTIRILNESLKKK